MSKYAKGVSNQSFEIGNKSGVKEKLFNPIARDNPDTVAPENKLQQFVGKAGKPPGLLGLKGREF
jgi:hypothetical protein